MYVHSPFTLQPAPERRAASTEQAPRLKRRISSSIEVINSYARFMEQAQREAAQAAGQVRGQQLARWDIGAPNLTGTPWIPLEDLAPHPFS